MSAGLAQSPGARRPARLGTGGRPVPASGAAGRPGASPVRPAARRGHGLRAASNPAACRELWRCVLAVAIRDLCFRGTTWDERRDVERWIGERPGRDFRLVCEMADLDPGAVHSAMLSLARRPFHERAVGYADWTRAAGRAVACAARARRRGETGRG